MFKISREFLCRLKLNKQPAYRIAQAAGVHYSTLSRLVNGIDPLRRNDSRIIRVAKVLGLSAEEAFETSEAPSEVMNQAEAREGVN